MKTALSAIGFTSMIAQVVLMRELVATFYGNELLFGLVLAVWLAWVAVGAWGVARLVGGGKPRSASFATLLALAGLMMPAQIALVRGSKTLLGVTPGAFVDLGLMVLVVVASLAPLCLLVGLLFTLGARLIILQGGTAGQAYVWESIGALGGGALFSFVLIGRLDPFQDAMLVLVVDLVVAGRLWLRRYGWRLHLIAPLLVLPLALLLLGGYYLGRAAHQATLAWQWSGATAGSPYDLVFAADSPYGRLIIQARGGQRVFFENGLLAFETQGTFPEEVAHFPLLAHPDPQRVLLIGGGVAGDLREILKHPVTAVTYVDLDPLLIEAAREHLPEQDAVVLADPRVTLALTDGRLFIKQNTTSYDVIILDLPEPATGALNRFYTQEFFREVEARLTPGGIFALGLPAAENYWSRELARRNGSVYHTLRSVFSHILVLPGEHNFFLASRLPLPTDPDVLIQRLDARDIATRWVTAGYIEYVLTTDRFRQVQRELDATAGTRLNRDLTPISYYYDLVLWLSRLSPSAEGGAAGLLRGAFERGSVLSLWWVGLPLVLILLAVRWQRGWAVPVAVAGVGLAQMTLQVVLLFGFQVLHGYVYAELSLIITAFMAGLALGGGLSNRLNGRWLLTGEHKARPAMIAILAVIILYSGVIPWLLARSLPAPELMFPLLALVAGLLTGMAFPLALLLMRGEGGRVAGLLYGADLVGGCLGALLGAVFLVPVLGIPQTCAAVALVAGAGLLALL